MALEWEIFEDADSEDHAQIMRVARNSESRAMTPGYTGVGDELAQPDLGGGVAEPSGLGLVVPGGLDPHHQV